MLGAVIAVLALASGASGPGIAVRIEEARDVRPDEVERLSATFAELIRASDRTVEVWSDQANEAVLTIKLDGAPTRIRLIAELSSPKKKLILDLPREERGWKQALLPLALDFFPPPPPAAQTAAANVAHTDSTPIASEPAGAPWPWIAIGAGAVSAGAGAVFGLASARAQDRLDHAELAPGEILELNDAASSRALAANVLFGAAIVAAGTGVVLWILED